MPSPIAFVPAAGAYNTEATKAVSAMHRIMVENHRPKPWNEKAFLAKVKMAKGKNPKGWRRRFLKMAREPEIGSVTGYVFSKHEVVICDDASECLAYDDSFLDQLKKAGYTDDDLTWLTVRSFITCPVPGDQAEPRGVLFVAKTYTHGFGPEDEEFTVAASELIATTLSR